MCIRDRVQLDVSSSHSPSDSRPSAKDNLALKVFIANFDVLHRAVTPHIDWLIKKFQAKLVIPKESYDQLELLHSPLLGPSQKAVVLLVVTQLSITADYRCLRQFIRALKRFTSLKSTSDILRKSYSKWVLHAT